MMAIVFWYFVCGRPGEPSLVRIELLLLLRLSLRLSRRPELSLWPELFLRSLLTGLTRLSRLLEQRRPPHCRNWRHSRVVATLRQARTDRSLGERLGLFVVGKVAGLR